MARDHKHARTQRWERGPLYGIPAELGKGISKLLFPLTVRTVEELKTLLDVYPLQHLCVDMSSVIDLSDCKAVLAEAPNLSVLQEVILGYAPLSQYEELLFFLLEQELECLSLDVSVISRSIPRFESFVDKCCTSPSKHHILQFYFLTLVPFEVLQKLIKGDDALLRFRLAFYFGDAVCSTLFRKESCLASSNLQHLQLDHELFEPSTLHYLSNALAGNCSLVTLSVNLECIVDLAGLGILGKGIASNTVLRAFRGRFMRPDKWEANKRRGGISQRTLEVFVNCLCRNQTLQCLALNYARLSFDTGVAMVFAKLLRINRSLRLLDLANLDINENGCHQIVNAMEQHEALEVLRLDGCNVAHADQARIEAHNKCIRKRVGQVLWDESTFLSKYFYRAYEWNLSGDIISNDAFLPVQKWPDYSRLKQHLTKPRR